MACVLLRTPATPTTTTPARARPPVQHGHATPTLAAAFLQTLPHATTSCARRLHDEPFRARSPPHFPEARPGAGGCTRPQS